MELCSFTPYVPLCLKKTSRNVDFNQCDFPKLHFLGWKFQSTVISRGEMRKSACHGWRVPKNATNGDTISITKNEISSFYIDAIHNTDCIVLHSKMTHIVQDILEWFFSHAWEVSLLTKYTCKLSCQLINASVALTWNTRDFRLNDKTGIVWSSLWQGQCSKLARLCHSRCHIALECSFGIIS